MIVAGFMGHSQLYERIIGGTADHCSAEATSRLWVIAAPLFLGGKIEKIGIAEP